MLVISERFQYLYATAGRARGHLGRTGLTFGRRCPNNAYVLQASAIKEGIWDYCGLLRIFKSLVFFIRVGGISERFIFKEPLVFVEGRILNSFCSQDPRFSVASPQRITRQPVRQLFLESQVTAVTAEAAPLL